jgi:chaperonin GroES
VTAQTDRTTTHNGTHDPQTSLPIRLLHDRVLVKLEGNEGERRSAAGIVIPATASVGRRLSWATAVGVGPNVRSIVTGDRVLFDPEDRSEVELQGHPYILLRERDVHAVAAQRVEPSATGLYL